MATNLGLAWQATDEQRSRTAWIPLYHSMNFFGPERSYWCYIVTMSPFIARLPNCLLASCVTTHKFLICLIVFRFNFIDSRYLYLLDSPTMNISVSLLARNSLQGSTLSPTTKISPSIFDTRITLPIQRSPLYGNESTRARKAQSLCYAHNCVSSSAFANGYSIRRWE